MNAAAELLMALKGGAPSMASLQPQTGIVNQVVALVNTCGQIWFGLETQSFYDAIHVIPYLPFPGRPGVFYLVLTPENKHYTTTVPPAHVIAALSVKGNASEIRISPQDLQTIQHMVRKNV